MTTMKTKDDKPTVGWKNIISAMSVNYAMYFPLVIVGVNSWVAAVVSVLAGGFVFSHLKIWKLAWKNLYKSPGFYRIEQYDISLESDEDFENLRDKNGARILASFNDSDRTVKTYKYDLKYSAPDDIKFDVEYENAIRGLHTIHELGHAYSAKWVWKHFWNKKKNRTLYIADEVARRIEEIIGFARITPAERAKINDVITSYARQLALADENLGKSVADIRDELIKKDIILGAHYDVRWIVAAANGDTDKEYDIFDQEYIDAFNKHWQDKPSNIIDIIIVMLRIKFLVSGLAGHYTNRAKKIHFLDRIDKVDFYGWPIKYNVARNRIFDVAVGTLEEPVVPNNGFIDGKNRVNLLSLMSDTAQKNLWEYIDRMVK